MESLVITWRELMIGVIAVLAVYAAELLVFLRLLARGRPRWQQALDHHEEHFETSRLESQLTEVRAQVAKLQAEVDTLRLNQQATPYNQAIQLAREGAEAARIVNECSISRGEAELIVALYQK
jgi:multidrug efflux pump subunit AcrA (membrane-fusion protein)